VGYRATPKRGQLQGKGYPKKGVRYQARATPKKESGLPQKGVRYQARATPKKGSGHPQKGVRCKARATPKRGQVPSNGYPKKRVRATRKRGQVQGKGYPKEGSGTRQGLPQKGVKCQARAALKGVRHRACASPQGDQMPSKGWGRMLSKGQATKQVPQPAEPIHALNLGIHIPPSICSWPTPLARAKGFHYVVEQQRK
jgi:hypothetical protein